MSMAVRGVLLQLWWNWSGLSTGTSLWVKVDSGNAIGESNEGDNVANGSVVITNGGGNPTATHTHTPSALKPQPPTRPQLCPKPRPPIRLLPQIHKPTTIHRQQRHYLPQTPPHPPKCPAIANPNIGG